MGDRGPAATPHDAIGAREDEKSLADGRSGASRKQHIWPRLTRQYGLVLVVPCAPKRLSQTDFIVRRHENYHRLSVREGHIQNLSYIRRCLVRSIRSF